MKTVFLGGVPEGWGGFAPLCVYQSQMKKTLKRKALTKNLIDKNAGILDTNGKLLRALMREKELSKIKD